MTYSRRLATLLINATVFFTIYIFSALGWVETTFSVPVGFLLPVLAIWVGGFIYLARVRSLGNGEHVGYLRALVAALLVAILSPWLSLFAMQLIGPFLSNLRHS